MEFEDRVSAYPNRYLLTDENGNMSHVLLERADEPIIPGTPLNAETFNKMAEAIKLSTAPAIESTEHPGCYYRIVDGVTEWLNPPMVIGIEFRTTERHNGKVVYTVIIPTVLAGNNTTKTFKHGYSVDDIIRTGGTLDPESSGTSLPYVFEGNRLEYSVSKANLWLVSNYDASTMPVQVQIWYTR